MSWCEYQWEEGKLSHRQARSVTLMQDIRSLLLPNFLLPFLAENILNVQIAL